MAEQILSQDEVGALFAPLVGLPVSLTWKGYGSAIFLELGHLTAPERVRREQHPKGEATIMIEWDWRVEDRTSIRFGSSNSGPQIETGIAKLRDLTIESIEAAGTLPELSVGFSNGLTLRSMIMVGAGDPDWSVMVPDGRWVYSCAGGCRIARGDEGSAGLSKEEELIDRFEETCSQRWRETLATPTVGRCEDCTSFVRLDGHFHLLDFGVCGCVASPCDGRVVCRSSGCPHFSSRP